MTMPHIRTVPVLMPWDMPSLYAASLLGLFATPPAPAAPPSTSPTR